MTLILRRAHPFGGRGDVIEKARHDAYSPAVRLYGVVDDFLDEAVGLFPTLVTDR